MSNISTHFPSIICSSYVVVHNLAKIDILIVMWMTSGKISNSTWRLATLGMILCIRSQFWSMNYEMRMFRYFYCYVFFVYLPFELLIWSISIKTCHFQADLQCQSRFPVRTCVLATIFVPWWDSPATFAVKNAKSVEMLADAIRLKQLRRFNWQSFNFVMKVAFAGLGYFQQLESGLI